VPKDRITIVTLDDDGNWSVFSSTDAGTVNIQSDYANMTVGQSRPQIQSRTSTQIDNEGYTLVIRDNYITGRSVIETLDPLGHVVGSATVTIPVSEIQRLNGVLPTATSPAPAPAPIYAQLDATGAGQVNYSYADGSSTVVTFANGLPATRIITTPGQNNTESVQHFAYVGGALVIQSNTATQFFYDDNGVSRIEDVTTFSANGRSTTIRTAYDIEGNAVRRKTSLLPLAY
jgi:hypothetical protein